MMDAKIKTDALPLAGSQAQQLLQRNIPGSMWLRFFYVFGIVMPLIVPLFQSKGLDMQEIFALQTIFALAMLVSEVPSGYLADVFGRRNIILAGSIAAGLGHSQLLFADSFAALVISSLPLALAHLCCQGRTLRCYMTLNLR